MCSSEVTKKMWTKQVVESLINAQAKHSETGKYEAILSDRIEECSSIPEFFNLPIDTISKFVSNANNYNLNTSRRLLKMSASKHGDQALLLLGKINVLGLSPIDYVSIVASLREVSPTCQKIADLYNVSDDISYDEELIRKSILKRFRTDAEKIEKPVDFEFDIFKACDKGKLQNVQYLVQNKIDPEMRDGDGNTVMMRAARANQPEIIDFLYEIGGHIEATNDCGQTPLLISAEEGNLKALQKLLEKGANPDAKDDEGNTAFIHAALNEHVDVLKYLLHNKSDINQKSNNGYSALTWCSYNGQADMVKFLLDNGAKKDIVNNYGKTADEISSDPEVLNLLRHH